MDEEQKDSAGGLAVGALLLVVLAIGSKLGGGGDVAGTIAAGAQSGAASGSLSAGELYMRGF